MPHFASPFQQLIPLSCPTPPAPRWPASRAASPRPCLARRLAVELHLAASPLVLRRPDALPRALPGSRPARASPRSAIASLSHLAHASPRPEARIADGQQARGVPHVRELFNRSVIRHRTPPRWQRRTRASRDPTRRSSIWLAISAPGLELTLAERPPRRCRHRAIPAQLVASLRRPALVSLCAASAPPSAALPRADALANCTI